MRYAIQLTYDLRFYSVPLESRLYYAPNSAKLENQRWHLLCSHLILRASYSFYQAESLIRSSRQ